MQYETMKREIGDERKLVVGEKKITHLLVHSSGDEPMAVENPTATEIQDVCSAVGLNAFLEVGCKSVMLYVAEMIPKLKTRTQKTGGADPSLQQGEGSKKGKGKKKK
ncbi:Signal recognition particle 19 kDa protein [Microtus ochrogaster]|uniref:Signal recognition particle 19 kDa protein n=1 Tax=Microtus ochrogaster TaxID=79684 RepID=A0A8J6KPH3_MICOH|nr:Signal recognition particle 19 kDa protein [Microtus ochrogaster]